MAVVLSYCLGSVRRLDEDEDARLAPTAP
jgi:hypothetical protein